jgi:hypothetical protein
MTRSPVPRRSPKEVRHGITALSGSILWLQNKWTRTSAKYRRMQTCRKNIKLKGADADEKQLGGNNGDNTYLNDCSEEIESIKCRRKSDFRMYVCDHR